MQVIPLTERAEGGAQNFSVERSAWNHTLRELSPGATYQLHAFTLLHDKESAAYASRNFTTSESTLLPLRLPTFILTSFLGCLVASLRLCNCRLVSARKYSSRSNIDVKSFISYQIMKPGNYYSLSIRSYVPT